MDTIKKKVRAGGRNWLVKIKKDYDNHYMVSMCRGFIIPEGILLSLFGLFGLATFITILVMFVNSQDTENANTILIPTVLFLTCILLGACELAFYGFLKTMRFQLGKNCSFQDMCQIIVSTYLKEQEQEVQDMRKEKDIETTAAATLKAWDGKIEN